MKATYCYNCADETDVERTGFLATAEKHFSEHGLCDGQVQTRYYTTPDDRLPVEFRQQIRNFLWDESGRDSELERVIVKTFDLDSCRVTKDGNVWIEQGSTQCYLNRRQLSFLMPEIRIRYTV